MYVTPGLLRACGTCQSGPNLSASMMICTIKLSKPHITTHDSKSVAMIRHAIDVAQQAVYHLNPGQVPDLTLDQPLYVIATQIQWNWPNGYGEDKFVILLGGLHLEMASSATIGYLLDGRGWTHALAQANIATPGTAESFLKKHMSRGRDMHTKLQPVHC